MVRFGSKPIKYFPFETYANASILEVAREARWLGDEARIILLHVIVTSRGATNDISTPSLPGLRSTRWKPGGAQGRGGAKQWTAALRSWTDA